jgi:hypothetical protein
MAALAFLHKLIRGAGKRRERYNRFRTGGVNNADGTNSYGFSTAFVVFTRKAPMKVASRGREFGAGTFMRLPFWSTMLSSVLLTMLPGVDRWAHCPGSLFVRFELPIEA